MHILNRIFALTFSFAALTSCATSSYRQPASTVVDDTTLSGLRVNPVRYILAPKWKVKIHNGEKTQWDATKVDLTSFAIGTDAGFKDFKARIQQLKDENDSAAKADKKGKGFLSKGNLIALNEIQKLLSLIEANKLNEQDRNDAFMHIAELASSFSYSFEYPIPQKIFVLAAPFKIANELYHPPMTQDASHAINVVATSGETDLSKVDPPNSTFWQNPGNIHAKDFYVGFNRPDVPNFSKPCTYSEARTGYGTHPGFVLKCEGKQWKFKFGNEFKTAPFISRLVWSLGYNAIPVDFVKISYVEYDRRIFSEFDMRKALATRITSGLGFDIKKFDMQHYFDPFDFAVQGAILKDGTSINSIDLKARLLKDQSLKAEKKSENFNPDFEKQIKLIVLKECSAEEIPGDSVVSIGPWSWNEVDHPERRETRAFSTLAAFINMFDVRTDNNKLRFATDASGRLSMQHIVSDLGSGLGIAENLLRELNGAPNLFPWDVVEAIHANDDSSVDDASVSKTDSKSDSVVERYHFKAYSVIQQNAAFSRAQVEDARWLLRRLAQISEAQLQDALIAAGWSAAEVRLYIEKLASRRDNLVKEFGLENEYALLRPRGVNQKLNFDPQTDRPLVVSTRPQVTAPVNKQKVINGMIQ